MASSRSLPPSEDRRRRSTGQAVCVSMLREDYHEGQIDCMRTRFGVRSDVGLGGDGSGPGQHPAVGRHPTFGGQSVCRRGRELLDPDQRPVPARGLGQSPGCPSVYRRSGSRRCRARCGAWLGGGRHAGAVAHLSDHEWRGRLDGGAPGQQERDLSGLHWHHRLRGRYARGVREHRLGAELDAPVHRGPELGSHRLGSRGRPANALHCLRRRHSVHRHSGRTFPHASYPPSYH